MSKLQNTTTETEVPVSDPFILVTTNKINPGQLDRVKALSARFAERVQESDTGLLAFNFYLNDEETEVSNVQVHKDAASMEAYLPLAQQMISEALELTQTESIQAYGTPGPITQQVLRMNEEQGAHVHVIANRIRGFTRSTAG